MDNKFIELDQFANEREILRLRKFDEEYKELMEESLLIISSGLCLEPTDGSGLIISSRLFPDIIDHERIESLGSADDDVQIAIMEYDWSYRSTRVSASGIDHYLAGWMKLGVQYPYTCMFGVAVKDKLDDFLKEPVLLDGGILFSQTLYSCTEDVLKLSSILSKKKLLAFSAFPGMMLELDGHNCVFKVSLENIDEDNSRMMVELVKTIRSVLD